MTVTFDPLDPDDARAARRLLDALGSPAPAEQPAEQPRPRTKVRRPTLPRVAPEDAEAVTDLDTERVLRSALRKGGVIL